MVLQKLLAVLDELEALKPKVRLQLDEQKTFSTNTQMHQLDGPTSVSYTPSVNNKASLNYSSKQVFIEIEGLLVWLNFLKPPCLTYYFVSDVTTDYCAFIFIEAE